ncbi:hypothetical protein C3470_05675, partial [Mycobacterium kansasii]
MRQRQGRICRAPRERARYLAAARSIAGLVATAVVLTAVGCAVPSGTPTGSANGSSTTAPSSPDGGSSAVQEDVVVRL